MSYSIVVPTWQGEQKIGKTAGNLFSAMAACNEKIEFIFVDDGSKDDTWKELIAIKNTYTELDIRLLSLNGNHGQLKASNCGISAASNNIIVTIDDDGKYDPHEIQTMVQYMKNNSYKVVFGIIKSEKRSAVKNLFYLIIRRVLFPKFSHKSFSSFRVFSKSGLIEIYKKSWYGGNLHTLWLLDSDQVGNYTLSQQNYSNSDSRYNLVKLFSHQRYLLAYLLLNLGLSCLICCSIWFCYALFTGTHNYIRLCLFDIFSIIFTIAAFILLKFWVAQSYKFNIREKFS